MNNYQQPGDILEFTSPSGGVTTGVPKQIGAILVVPIETVAQTLRFRGLIRGVIRYTKAPSQAWAEGARVFWDSGNGRFTTVSPGNLFVGFALEVTGSGSSGSDLTGCVMLNGVAADTGT